LAPSKAHLLTSAPCRARRASPVSGQLCPGDHLEGVADLARGFPSPFGRRHWLLEHPVPAGASALLTVGLPGREWPGPARGFHVPHAQESAGVGALSIPGRWCSTGWSTFSSRHPPPSQTASPVPRSHFPSSGGRDYETSSRVHVIHPSGLPLTCGPRMGARALGLHPGLRTPQSPTTPARTGTNLEHRLGTTHSASAKPPTLRCSLVTCDLASHRRVRDGRGTGRGGCAATDRQAAGAGVGDVQRALGPVPVDGGAGRGKTSHGWAETEDEGWWFVKEAVNRPFRGTHYRKARGLWTLPPE
jgi:hypothetical protein